MNKLKWIWIGLGMKLLKRGLRYRISGDQQQWLQPLSGSSIANRNEFILQYCKSKAVLHIGFADAPFTSERLNGELLLHTRLKKSALHVWGIDTNVNAVAEYIGFTNDKDVAVGSVADLTKEVLQNYQLVLVGELLEHLPDPFHFVHLCEARMYPGQELLVTVPNYTSLDSIAAALHSTESIHPDHQWYFSPYTLLNKFHEEVWELLFFGFGLYGKAQPHFIHKQFPATGDCLIAVFKKK